MTTGRLSHTCECGKKEKIVEIVIHSSESEKCYIHLERPVLVGVGLPQDEQPQENAAVEHPAGRGGRIDEHLYVTH